MHKTSLFVCWFLLLGILLVFPVKSQTIKSISHSIVDSLLNPRMMDGGENVLSFCETDQSIGVLLECDSPKCLIYSFRNVGNKAIKIRDVKTFCGCTSATYDKHVIEPDSAGKIVLTYSPKNKIGTIDERIYVYTIDSEKYPVACLRLFGEVKDENQWRHLPLEMGNLRLKRKNVEFMMDSSFPLSVERIWCGNSGSVPLEIVAKGLPDYVTFKMEPEILQPGEEGDMIVTIENKKLIWNEVLEFQFYLEGTGADFTKCFINVKVDCLK